MPEHHNQCYHQVFAKKELSQSHPQATTKRCHLPEGLFLSLVPNQHEKQLRVTLLEAVAVQSPLHIQKKEKKEALAIKFFVKISFS